MNISRRGLITGLICFTAAPAIVRIESLMPVKVMEPYGISPFMLDHNREVYLYLERLKRDLIRHFCIPNEFLKDTSL